jgi:short-chain 2-methylacyl-CoA dehydrogenase
MNFDLTAEQQDVRRLVRDFAEGEVRPVAAELDRTKSFPYEIVRKLGELGLMGIPYPEEYGGGGADNLSYAIAVEELTRVDSSVAITVAAHTSLGTWPIYAFGSDAQKDEWLPRLCSGQKLGAFGLTEPEAGSDAGNTRTRATLEHGQWVINGSKAFITNSGTTLSGLVTITARTGEHEISNILVPNGTPGYEIGEPYRKMGWNASDTRPLSFEDCRVPEGNLLGDRGRGYAQFLATLDDGRVAIAALAVGCIQACLDLSVQYAGERQTFGVPIGRKQGLAFQIADLEVMLNAARLLTYRAAAMKDGGAPVKEFKQAAAVAKLYATESAVSATRIATQVFGGYGFMEEYPVARFYRDAKVLEIGEGTSEVQRMLIARGLGLPVE